MRYNIKLNLDKIVSAQLSSGYFLFDAITNMDNWWNQENVTGLEIEVNASYRRLNVFVDGASQPDYFKQDAQIESCALSGTSITFECSISSSQMTKLAELVSADVVELNQDGNTTLIVYKQNSENDALFKTLTFVAFIDGKFNQVIGLKTIDIDIYQYESNFNYVYIPLLKRYYFVNSVDFISADITRLHLKEDVLP